MQGDNQIKIFKLMYIFYYWYNGNNFYICDGFTVIYREFFFYKAYFLFSFAQL